MNWRFADLRIRTKFLITLGIPVAGMILLIGKQVDSSLKRNNVLGYMSRQAGGIQLVADVVDRFQEESALSMAIMLKVVPDHGALKLARAESDEAIARLANPHIVVIPGFRPVDVVSPLATVRKRMDDGNSTAPETVQAYQAMNEDLLRHLGEMSKQTLDMEVNAKLFAHQSLLYTKNALGVVRTELLRMLAKDGGAMDLGSLNRQITLYQTNLQLFERDAPPQVLASFQEAFQGADVNMLRALLGMIQSGKGPADLGLSGRDWWDLSGKAMGQLHEVEQRSIDSITQTSRRIAAGALRRLVLVVVALLIVVGTVLVMATVIVRGLQSTISEVSMATASLARGDVRARVPVKSKDEVGQMARSFNEVIEAMRSLSASADAIGQGNYDAPVVVRGDQDVLGHSLTRMRDNLRAARDRDMEQTRLLVAEKEKLEQANARIRVLIREIHHRVKNNLQVVSSMLRLQAGNITDERLQQVFAQSQSRVASMALIHEKLYKGNDLAHMDLSRYIRDLFAELVQLNKVKDGIRYRTAIDPDLVLDLDTMVPLGLILNELITNSFKHAFSGREQGFINLRIHRADDGQIDLHYSDDGKGIPKEKQDRPGDTLGRSLIGSLVEQLNGRMTMKSDASGTEYHIQFPGG
ncbi:MAG: nitrate- and nitrite sensing domain-containing protein [Flavobacteriales bacterium]|nr:nitrate- and nitrite sensing domain-containing protein [Flavobacteriales bacterium]MEB2341495.1 nitrate- and nitrite sensing domain-containing protein [Flavobacteriia bacterium]